MSACMVAVVDCDACDLDTWDIALTHIGHCRVSMLPVNATSRDHSCGIAAAGVYIQQKRRKHTELNTQIDIQVMRTAYAGRETATWGPTAYLTNIPMMRPQEAPKAKEGMNRPAEACQACQRIWSQIRILHVAVWCYVIRRHC